MDNSDAPQQQAFKWTLPFDALEFGKHIGAEDELQALVRGHLYVEHILIEFLRISLPAFSLLNLERLNFATKVDLCAALGVVSDEAIPAIKKLNSIRNKIAHNLHYRFDSTEKRAFVAALPTVWRNAALQRTNAATGTSAEQVPLYDILLVIVVLLDWALKRYVEWRETRKEGFEILAKLMQETAIEREEFGRAQILLQHLSADFVQTIEDH